MCWFVLLKSIKEVFRASTFSLVLGMLIISISTECLGDVLIIEQASVHLCFGCQGSVVSSLGMRGSLTFTLFLLISAPILGVFGCCYWLLFLQIGVFCPID